MKGWTISGIVVGALAVGLLLMNGKDLYRYLKISSM
jgi:hypothetical protein